MLSLGRRAILLHRIATGSLAFGGLALYVTNHGPRFGIPAAWVEYPSIPGTAGTFGIGFGLAALLLLAVTGNLDRRHTIALAVAAALVAASIAIGLYLPLARLDDMGIGPTTLAAAALVALVWHEPKARGAATLGGLLSVAASVAFTLAPRIYAGPEGTPVGPGIPALHTVSNALYALAPLPAIAALLLAATSPRAHPL